MKNQIRSMILAGVGILLLTLGLTALISGKDAVAIRKQMDMENYLPMILCREVPWEYEEEMLKAQAVLARSSLYFRLKERNVNGEELNSQLEQFRKDFGKEKYREAYRKMEKAVRLTRGQVIVYQGEVCPGVFHRVSSGETRDGMEVLGETEKTFLKSVDSSQDIRSKDYLHGHYFTEESLRQRIREAFPSIQLEEGSLMEQMTVEKRDSQEYVLEIKVGDQIVSGEEFRKKMELSSGNFTIQNLDGKIRFLCKGLGHGLGLSQFGANELAKEGMSYQQILFTYFPDIALKRKTGSVYRFHQSGNSMSKEFRILY